MLNGPINAYGFTTSTYSPMDCLNIDLIGPLPGKGYILVQLYRIIDPTAESTAECLLQHFGRFVVLSQLRSDRGPHFITDVITIFLAL